MKLENSTYNVLKFIALTVLPGLATVYFAVAGQWHLTHTDQVVGTITAFDTFLGAMLHVSTKSYTPPVNGNFTVDLSDPAKEKYGLEMTTPIPDLKHLDHVLLKVVPGASVEMKTTKP
jgi:hypothetical protein